MATSLYKYLGKNIVKSGPLIKKKVKDPNTLVDVQSAIDSSLSKSITGVQKQIDMLSHFLLVVTVGGFGFVWTEMDKMKTEMKAEMKEITDLINQRLPSPKSD